MDEIHREAAEIARHFLISHREPLREDSRLFEDLQQLALDALKTIRAGEPQHVSFPGGARGYWWARRT